VQLPYVGTDRSLGKLSGVFVLKLRWLWALRPTWE
jgi:hypothetical protein